MDKQQLRKALEPFREMLKDRGFALDSLTFEPAYPGDSSSSYVLTPTARWIKEQGQVKSLEILLDTLWKTTTVETRISVFCFNLKEACQPIVRRSKIA